MSYDLNLTYQAKVREGKAGTPEAAKAYLEITSNVLKETFTVDLKDADKARAFATALTSTAKTAGDTAKSRSLQVSSLERQLETAKKATAPIDTAKKALKAVKADDKRLKAAKKAWEAAQAKPDSPLS